MGTSRRAATSPVIAAPLCLLGTRTRATLSLSYAVVSYRETATAASPESFLQISSLAAAEGEKYVPMFISYSTTQFVFSNSNNTFWIKATVKIPAINGTVGC